MLDFEVKPSKSIGEFKLGMPLPHAISWVQKNYKNIPTVELKYCEEDLLNNCILIDLVEEGIRLKFEPRTQRLLVIEVYDLTKLTLRYAGVAFSGPDINTTFVLIYSRFGPSFPGNYDPDTRIYHLHYPGISFAFLIPAEHEILDETELPLEFGDGKTPSTTGMTLYHGPRQAPTLPALARDSFYFEEVHVMVSKCIYFTKRRCKLDFYSTAQDVVTELGRPDRIYNKLEDKMRIHSGDKSSDIVCEDYFYNYFSLGLDILFDMRTHVVKKFILHTNFPCHYDFNVYVKCNYRLFFEDSPYFGRPLASTPLSSPDDAFARKNGTNTSGHNDRRSRDAEEMVNALASGEAAKGEEEEGSLTSNRKGKRKAKARARAKAKAKASENKKEEAQTQTGVRQSILGDALVREGVLREDETKEENEGEKEKEKGEEEGVGTEHDSERKHGEEEVLSVSPADTYAISTARPTPTATKEKGKEKVRTVHNPEPPKCIDPDMQWEEVKALLPGPPPSKPVVNSVGASGSPFGSTRFFGCKDVIFEVMRNQHIASVCLFSSDAKGGK